LAAGALITVIGPDQDPANIQGQLESLLISRGFRVVSAPAGSSSLIRAGRKEYALSFSYTTRTEQVDVFLNFSAILVDLSTGALVAACVPERRQLTGKKVGTLLKEFLDRVQSQQP
jgi:hypothetical protein